VSDWRIAAALAAVVGVAIGAVIGGRFESDPLPPATTPVRPPAAVIPDPSTAVQLAALRDAVELEQRARAALEDELDALRELITGNSNPAPAASDPAPPTHGRANDAEPWFDVAALVAAGRSEEAAERLRSRFEQAELDELYVRDTATREGWARTSRLRNRLAEIRDELRTELGDADYDWLLYASGSQNRVLIRDVLGDSPAADAGIESGDVIVRYDGQRILSPQELRRATTEGRVGETISVDIERGDERLRVYVPRGPLGTRLGQTRRPPDES
jgi:membrane-associated protease RseP (regulator of RpoE activity)